MSLRRRVFPALASTLMIAAGLVGLASPVEAGGPVFQIALSQGDDVSGVGLVTRIDNVVVNNQGDWIVEVDTDLADTNFDQAVVKSGSPFLREGQALDMPMMATLDSFDAINLSNAGHSGWNFFLDGTTGGSDDSGIYFDATLVIQEGMVTMAPELSPGTPYIGYFEAKINDFNEILIMASMDDPAINTSVDRVLMVVSVDQNGVLLSETARYKEGDVLPGQTEAVTDFGTGPHSFAFNNRGDIMYYADLTGDTTLDGTIYLNSTLLAQEGGPSPVPNETWFSLSSPELDVNNSGQYVFSGRVSGDTGADMVIVRNGQVFVREGDILPATGGFALTGIGSAPIDIDDYGNVLWYGAWDDPDPDRDTGLFLNETLLVQEGVTTVGGVVIDTLASGQDALSMSDNGRYIIFEAFLADGNNVAVLVDTMTSRPILFDPLPGQVGGGNTFIVQNVTPDAKVYFAAGLQFGATNVPGCPGVQLLFNNPVLLGVDRADIFGTAEINVFIPNAASGRSVYFQALERVSCRVTNLVLHDFP